MSEEYNKINENLKTEITKLRREIIYLQEETLRNTNNMLMWEKMNNIKQHESEVNMNKMKDKIANLQVEIQVYKNKKE